MDFRPALTTELTESTVVNSNFGRQGHGHVPILQVQCVVMRRFLIFIFFNCFFFTIEKAFSEEPRHLFSLNEALYYTLSYQDEIKISELEVLHQAGVARQESGPFDPVIDADFTEVESLDVQSLAIGAKTHWGAYDAVSNLEVHKKSRLGTLYNFSYRLEQARNPLFPLEGVAPSKRFDTSVVSFTVEQPLLRDFMTGLDTMTEEAEHLRIQAFALDNLQNASKKLLDTAIAYWEWVAAKRELKIQGDSVERNQSLVDNTAALIEKNQLAANDINQPMANLATQKINAITAGYGLYASLQQLKFAIGIITPSKEQGLDWESEDFPSVTFTPEMYNQMINIIADYAIDHRYDIRASFIDQQSAAMLVEGAYNGTLPLLNLFAGARSSNFVLGERARDFFRATTAHNPQTDLTFGIKFSMPLHNDNAEGLLIQLQSRLTQTFFRTQLLTKDAIKSVFDALGNQLSLSFSLQQADLAVSKYEVLVANEREKLQGGFSTLFILIDFENKLTDALSRQTLIQKQYLQNIAQLRYLTATLLKVDDCLTNMEIENLTTFPKLE